MKTVHKRFPLLFIATLFAAYGCTEEATPPPEALPAPTIEEALPLLPPIDESNFEPLDFQLLEQPYDGHKWELVVSVRPTGGIEIHMPEVTPYDHLEAIFSGQDVGESGWTNTTTLDFFEEQQLIENLTAEAILYWVANDYDDQLLEGITVDQDEDSWIICEVLEETEEDSRNWAWLHPVPPTVPFQEMVEWNCEPRSLIPAGWHDF